MAMNSIRLIHMADIHLGYTGSISLICRENEKEAGRYLREVDIETAVSKMTIAIINEQPRVDLVIIAGDLFHRSAPYPRAIRYAARMVRMLIEQHIEVVIVDGNHETSSWLHTGSPTTFLKEFGAHVLNDGQYHIIRDEKWLFLQGREAGPLAIHALPYRAVLEGNFTGVAPIPDYINVLITHGRVRGADMPDLNTLGLKTAGIPSELLHQPWDYVALGDRHIHGIQPLKDVPAYYAGSLEALNFGEAAYYPTTDGDPRTKHGSLNVKLSLHTKAEVTSLLHHAFRPVLRHETIDAEELDSNALMDQLRQRLSLTLPVEALVLLEIQGCTLATWQQLDHAEIELLREKVRRYELRWNFKQEVQITQNGKAAGQVSLIEQWEQFLEENATDLDERSWYLTTGKQRIEDARLQLAKARAQIEDED
jgi:DNA repair exonuclease SbcCD nuclease subunit